MGLCYSLRPRLFGDPSGSISNAATSSDTEQPPELSAPLRAGDLRHGGGGGDPPLRDGQHCKPARGDSPDGLLLLLQNGGDGKQQQHKPIKVQQPQQQHPLQKGWDKLRLEEKEAEKEAKKVSKNIDRVLKEQKREYKQTHRLLLLACRRDGWEGDTVGSLIPPSHRSNGDTVTVLTRKNNGRTILRTDGRMAKSRGGN